MIHVITNIYTGTVLPLIYRYSLATLGMVLPNASTSLELGIVTPTAASGSGALPYDTSWVLYFGMALLLCTLVLAAAAVYAYPPAPLQSIRFPLFKKKE